MSAEKRAEDRDTMSMAKEALDEIARLDRELAHANRRINKLIDALKPGRKTLSAGEKLRIWKKSVLANGIRREPDGQ